MHKLFLGRRKQNQTRKAPIIIVSGLPRSGTSMMMKILAEGYVPIVSDEYRQADADNPNGYFEYETVKQIPAGNVAWLGDARGKAVKVVSSLLEYLPSRFSYKIIFMERDFHEVLASQRKMLQHRNKPFETDDAQIEEQFHKHLSLIKPWLARQPNMDVLYISYNSLMEKPERYCRQVIEFVSCEPSHLEQMIRVPDRELYRNHATGSHSRASTRSTNDIINEE